MRRGAALWPKVLGADTHAHDTRPGAWHSGPPQSADHTEDVLTGTHSDDAMSGMKPVTARVKVWTREWVKV